MIKLVLLTGGNSIEREISFKSCENILKFIDNEKYNVKVIKLPSNFSKNLDWVRKIMEFNPHIVFNTMHGGEGEDGTMQGFLSMLSLKYIGSKTLSSAICMDKNLSKTIMNSCKIPTPPYVFVKKEENIENFYNNLAELGFPLIVKPNKGGGSIGISVCNTMEEIHIAAKKVIDLDQDILIEKFIYGKEVNCTIFQTDDELCVLPLLDINTENLFFDYSDKYEKDTNISFSSIPKFLQKMITEICKKTFKKLQCEGYANVDLILQEEQIYVLEVNTLPGLTEKSLLPKAVETSQLDFSKFMDNLINFALK